MHMLTQTVDATVDITTMRVFVVGLRKHAERDVSLICVVFLSTAIMSGFDVGLLLLTCDRSQQ